MDDDDDSVSRSTASASTPPSMHVVSDLPIKYVPSRAELATFMRAVHVVDTYDDCDETLFYRSRTCWLWRGAARLRFRGERWYPRRLLCALGRLGAYAYMQGRVVESRCGRPDCVHPMHALIFDPYFHEPTSTTPESAAATVATAVAPCIAPPTPSTPAQSSLDDYYAICSVPPSPSPQFTRPSPSSSKRKFADSLDHSRAPNAKRSAPNRVRCTE